MFDDDGPIGHLLSRREALSALGLASVSLWTIGFPTQRPVPGTIVRIPNCVAKPEQTEGPYFVDEKLNRSDIRSDPASGALSVGTPLKLTFNVAKLAAAACAPAAGVLVDVWHCDAFGVYSDEQDMNAGFNSAGKKFLRGYQVTDGKGTATFQTIYPGWYEGRAVHIHFKIRTAPGEPRGHDLTSQLYFPDALNAKVQGAPPYPNKANGRMLNADDGIFHSGGTQLTLAPVARGNGYEATFEIGLQLG